MATRSKVRAVVLLSLAAAALGLLIFWGRDQFKPHEETKRGQPNAERMESETVKPIEGEAAPTGAIDSSMVTIPAESDIPREFSEANLISGISLRERPPLDVAYPESFAAAYDELVAAVEDGDSDSAFILYRSLKRCQNHRYATDSELESAIREMHQINSTISRADNAEHREMVDPSTTEQYLRQEHRFCSNVSHSYLDDADNWRIRAADLGNLTSQMELGTIVQGTSEGAKYLEMAWLQGHFDALAWIAKQYSGNGDKVTAYAYQLAYNQLSGKDFEDRSVPSSPSSERWKEADEKALADAEFGLSPRERELANSIAESLIQSNERCCLRRNIFHVRH